VFGSSKKADVTFAHEAISETEFYYPGDAGVIEFVKNTDGKVKGYVLRSPDLDEPIEVERVE
jgi:hypothetical protein